MEKWKLRFRAEGVKFGVWGDIALIMENQIGKMEHEMETEVIKK